MTTLRRLELADLLLETGEALQLLDEACMTLCERLAHLVLINPSKYPLELLHPAAFVNLQKLYMSPQNLGDELIQVLAANPSLQELHIVQNSYYDETEVILPQVSPKVWQLVQFKVFLRTWCVVVHKDIIWQEKAPVVSVIYDCPMTKVVPLCLIIRVLIKLCRGRAEEKFII